MATVGAPPNISPKRGRGQYPTTLAQRIKAIELLASGASVQDVAFAIGTHRNTIYDILGPVNGRLGVLGLLKMGHNATDVAIATYDGKPIHASEIQEFVFGMRGRCPTCSGSGWVEIDEPTESRKASGSGPDIS